MRAPPRSAFALSLGLLAAAGGWGCSGANWLEVKLSGADDEGNAVDETIDFEGSSASGMRDGDFHPSILGDGVTTHLGAYFSTSQQETHYGDEPVALLSITQRVLDGEAEPQHTIVDHRAKFGLGLMSGSLTMNFKNVKTVPASTFDIERWHFTGNAKHPLEFRGRSVPLPDGTHPLKAEVAFEFRADCSSEIIKSGGLCGGMHHENWEGTEVVRKVETITGGPHCPTEVLKTFAGDGVGADFRWMPGEYMQVVGGERLDCVLTEGDKRFLCGAEETGVKSDGCTWDVGAVASVDQASGGGTRYTRMWMTVSARAREGCERAVTYCNSDVRAYSH